MKKTKVEKPVKKVYSFTLNCHNCYDGEETVQIPFGTSANDFLRNRRCRNCGCFLRNEQ